MQQKSILENVSEHDVVTVHNPLDTVFVGKVARSVVAPSRPQLTQTGNPNADAYIAGIQQAIGKGGHTSMQHVQQSIEFKPGQTMRLPGEAAVVIVRQIVKEIMQREKASKRMADPVAIMEYEKRVVLDHASMLSNLSVETAEQRLQRQLNELNPVTETKDVGTDEQAFPTEQGDAQKRGRPTRTAAQ